MEEIWKAIANLVGQEDPYFSRTNYSILIFWSKEDFPIEIYYRFYITAAIVGFFLKFSSVFTHIFMTTFKMGYVCHDTPAKVVEIIKGKVKITYDKGELWSYSAELL